ncbi:MAG: VWA domain-containing protein [Pyrinomonadaceae bacterium]
MLFQKLSRRFIAFLLLAVFLAGVAFVRVATISAQSKSAAPNANRPRRTNDAPTPQQQQQTSATPQASPTPPASASPQATPKDEEVGQDDGEVVRVESNLTNVLFTATDKQRRFFDKLKQSDIRVLEDGQPQQIFTFQTQVDLPLSLAILIDTSGSQINTLPDEKEAARDFVDQVVRPAKDEAAVVSFTGEATLEQGLSGNVARVRRAIDKIEYVNPSGYTKNGPPSSSSSIPGRPPVYGTPPLSGGNQSLAGSTAIWDALWITSDEVLAEAPERTRRAIILVTDGVNTSGQKKLREAVDRAIKADAIIYAVGIGDSYQFTGVDEGALRKVTELTGGRAYFPRSPSELRAAFAQIQRDLREQYLVAYSPTNKTRDGSFRQIKIEIAEPELRKQNLRLTYREGYFAKSVDSISPKPQNTKRRRS